MAETYLFTILAVLIDLFLIPVDLAFIFILIKGEMKDTSKIEKAKMGSDEKWKKMLDDVESGKIFYYRIDSRERAMFDERFPEQCRSEFRGREMKLKGLL